MDLSYQSGSGASCSKRLKPCILQEPCIEGGPVKLLEPPCLESVLHRLGSRELMALFRTSKSMATAMLHIISTHRHTRQPRSGITLQPDCRVQWESHSSRRAAVLGLAKHCPNLHLKLDRHTFPFDVSSISECITHLPLQRMTRLHTLTLERRYEIELGRIVRGDVLARVIQGGGLPMLRTLNLIRMDGDVFGYRPAEAGMLLRALAPALGPVIKYITIDRISDTQALRDYPKLKRVEINTATYW